MFFNFSHFFLSFCFFLSLYVVCSNFFCVRDLYYFFSLLFFFFVIVFWFLGVSLLLSDFSIVLSFESSNILQLFVYKLSTIWSNNEGSLFLWCFLTIICGFYFLNLFYCRFRLDFNYLKYFLNGQFLLIISFFFFLLFFFHCIFRLDFLVFEGCELNFLLQDINLVIHPPLLYIGQNFYSVLFLFCFPFVFNQIIINIEKTLIVLYFWKTVNILGFLFLTIGIFLGSRWAYYELGWGGFWYWDSVENLSLVPWLLSLSFLHCLLISVWFRQFFCEVILVGYFLYPICVLSTFLVRSGVVQSVHSFVENEIIIPMFLTVFLLFLLSLFFVSFFVFRKYSLVFTSKFDIMILYCVFFFLLLFGFLILIITFLPIFLFIFFGKEMFFSSYFYNTLLLYFLSCGLVLFYVYMTVHYRLKYYIFIFSVFILGFVNFFSSNVLLFNIFIFLLIFTVSLYNLFYEKLYFRRFKFFFIVHFGFLLSLIGLLLIYSFKKEYIGVFFLNDLIFFDNFCLYFQDINYLINYNYLDNYVSLLIQNIDFGRYLNEQLFSEKRFYFNQNLYNIYSIIYSNLFFDIYVLCGEGSFNEGWYIRLITLPFISWFWLGELLIIGCIGLVVYCFISYTFRK
uniref:Cytochrome C-type biogenesis protein CCMF n=1 Tax=Cyanidium caldarium TaxID=2771 RepID=A0A7H0WBA0_CYACA|nr:cytochrome C-type biogenesis protein CCMF [Cyanidium caldarium]QNR39829.1 cytochrome C-type biogenesis protein CCMF [Cyanidium caldarium]